MTYLWIIMTLISIILCSIFIMKELWRYIYRNRIWLREINNFSSEIFILNLLLKKSNILNGRYHCYFLFPMSSHMSQIIEHMNSSNRKMHSYYQTSKIIVNSGSKKGENNDNPSLQLNHPKNSLLMSIVHTPENIY